MSPRLFVCSLPLMLGLLAACGDKDGDDTGTSATDDTAAAGDDTGGEVDDTPGQLSIRFAIEPDYQEAMDEDAIGTFRGSVYWADDVGATGPVEGAVALESIEVEGVDLVAANPTAVMHTTGELAPGEVVILGFLDSDGNADPEDPGPDAKDPVTLPSDNDFDVVPGETTEVEVFFGFLNPS